MLTVRARVFIVARFNVMSTAWIVTRLRVRVGLVLGLGVWLGLGLCLRLGLGLGPMFGWV